jgi:hypothetical protein
MCKHPYAAKWSHDDRCPNLVHVNASGKSSVPVELYYPVGHTVWPSLVDFWSDWYNQYMKADYPRLIIRFEDLIFHQKQLVATVCECAGAVPKEDSFSYVVSEGKWGAAHQKSSNLISAMIKYGSTKSRLASLTREDLEYAAEHADPNLVRIFQYQQPLAR